MNAQEYKEWLESHDILVDELREAEARLAQVRRGIEKDGLYAWCIELEAAEDWVAMGEAALEYHRSLNV